MAAQLVQKARAEARDILKGVETAIAEEERNEMQEQRAALQQHLENTRQDFAKQLDSVMAAKRKHESEAIEACRKNMEQASDWIVERVMQHGTD